MPLGPDRDRAVRDVADLVPRRERRRLGRAVHVQEATGRSRPQHVAHPARLDRLAAEEHGPAVPERGGNLARDGVEQRGRHEDRRHALGLERRGERAWSDRRRLRNRHDRRPVEKRAPELEGRRVERRIGELRNAIAGAELDDEAAWCDRDGVLDVGERGRLRLTLRNVGIDTLTATTGTLFSTTPGVMVLNPLLTFSPSQPFANATAQAQLSLTGLTAPTNRWRSACGIVRRKRGQDWRVQFVPVKAN